MIRFDHVTKCFNGRTVLDDISFEIQKGEIFCIVGPSGTGKSVTLKHMVRLLTPTSGSVWLNDVEISSAEGHKLEQIRNHFGYLFQGGALLGWLTVAENIALPLREHTNLREEAISARVSAALEKVGLTDAGTLFPSEISGGMQKRAGLARAIVRRSRVVLYDEPTSGLDPVTSITITHLIQRINAELGVTSVVVTHDLQAALLIADRIVMLKDGHIVALDTPDRFVQNTHPAVRQFLEAQFITPKSYEAMKETWNPATEENA